MNIKYCGPLGDSSGFAEAARLYIKALVSLGVQVTTEFISFESQKTAQGLLGELALELKNRPLDYKIKIIHATPENFPRLIEPGKYNIGYTTWETSKMPKFRVDLCNLMNEIWVPSQYNVDVFKNSGVKVPVYKIPHIAPPSYFETSEPLQLGNMASDVYKFCSILQWSERKNPAGLLRAYLTEFTRDDKVLLILKTFIQNFSSNETDQIKQEILILKNDIGLSNYPNVLLLSSLMTNEQIKSLHATYDCFVLLSRSEGWGLPYMEAMCQGKPCIGTKYSGNLEFMNDENSFLVPATEVPVSNMMWTSNINGKSMRLYTGDQEWAAPDILATKRLMRYCFGNKQESKEKGQLGISYIKEHFTAETVGALILARLMTLS